MKFITAEQFLKADTKVQNAILEWWKPSIGDLVYDKDNVVDVVVPKLCVGDYKRELDKSKVIPLLVEGQLREFIEEITDCKIDIIYSYLDGSYTIFVDTCFLKIKSDNLLQVLWQVANKIIKGDVKNEEM